MGAQFLLICMLLARFWPVCGDCRLARWLALFGRHSLKLFVASIFLDYLLKALLATLHAGAAAALGVWALEMGVLLGLAYLYDEPRQRVRVRPALSGVVEG